MQRTNKRFDVLAVLRENPLATVREISTALNGLSLGTIWYHMKVLRSEGFLSADLWADRYHDARVRAGKAGRGVDAHSPKQGKGRGEAALQKRIESIVERSRTMEMQGCGVDVIHNCRHAQHGSLKAIKF